MVESEILYRFKYSLACLRLCVFEERKFGEVLRHGSADRRVSFTNIYKAKVLNKKSLRARVYSLINF